jgi:hypothetical protein
MPVIFSHFFLPTSPGEQIVAKSDDTSARKLSPVGFFYVSVALLVKESSHRVDKVWTSKKLSGCLNHALASPGKIGRWFHRHGLANAGA